MCRNTGYIGRTVIAEVLQMDSFLTSMIGEGATINEIQQAAKSRGMRTLSDAGRELVARGITDIAEYERVLG